VEPDETAGAAGGQAASEVWTRKRQPKSELRQLMLDTGREILQEEGIETRSSNLTFKRVFDRVERDTGRHLTNASVIKRIWEDQSDYQADVLVSIAQDENRPEVGATMAAVEDVLASTDLSSVEGRLRGMSQLCRVAGAASREAIAASTNWPLWVSVVAIASTSTNDDQRERMRAALAEGYELVTEFWEGAYGGLIALLGLRPRAPRTVRQFAIAVSALSEGDSLRHHVDRTQVTVDLPTGRDGQIQEWTLYSLAVDAVAQQFYEVDPDSVPPGS
jgi:hypothetical protein